jgi:hypothetical protein
MEFKSFFQAGFEGSTGYNRHRQWIDQVCATQHDLFVELDYRLLREVGIQTVREVIRWPLVDRGRRYDFSTVEPFLAAAARHEIEIIYDLFHFGYPDDVDLFSADFPPRFADYCYAVANFITRQTSGACSFTPVNEPSYFAWAAGEAGLFAPHQIGRSWELKVQLIKAAIQGINALHAACPTARIINADPLCRVALPIGDSARQAEVEHFNNQVVFQSWDMLCGRLLPELGGSPKHLDIVGINYYWTNQWEWQRANSPLAYDDPRRCVLSNLIRAVWQRYGAEMLITETSEVGVRRATWMCELTGEVKQILQEQIPLRGVCLYPILGMPEWHAPSEWTRMGLWDLVEQDGQLLRVPEPEMLQALREAMRVIQSQARAGRQSLPTKKRLAQSVESGGWPALPSF